MHFLSIYTLGVVSIYTIAFLVRLILSWTIGFNELPEDQLEEQLEPQPQQRREGKPEQQSGQQIEQQHKATPHQRVRRRVLPSNENGRPLGRRLWL